MYSRYVISGTRFNIYNSFGTQNPSYNFDISCIRIIIQRVRTYVCTYVVCVWAKT